MAYSKFEGCVHSLISRGVLPKILDEDGLTSISLIYWSYATYLVLKNIHTKLTIWARSNTTKNPRILFDVIMWVTSELNFESTYGNHFSQYDAWLIYVLWIFPGSSGGVAITPKLYTTTKKELTIQALENCCCGFPSSDLANNLGDRVWRNMLTLPTGEGPSESDVLKTTPMRVNIISWLMTKKAK